MDSNEDSELDEVECARRCVDSASAWRDTEWRARRAQSAILQTGISRTDAPASVTLTPSRPECMESPEDPGANPAPSRRANHIKSRCELHEPALYTFHATLASECALACLVGNFLRRIQTVPTNVRSSQEHSVDPGGTTDCPSCHARLCGRLRRPLWTAECEPHLMWLPPRSRNGPLSRPLRAECITARSSLSGSTRVGTPSCCGTPTHEPMLLRSCPRYGVTGGTTVVSASCERDGPPVPAYFGALQQSVRWDAHIVCRS